MRNCCKVFSLSNDFAFCTFHLFDYQERECKEAEKEPKCDVLSNKLGHQVEKKGFLPSRKYTAPMTCQQGKKMLGLRNITGEKTSQTGLIFLKVTVIR